MRACSCPTKVPRNNTVGRGANSSNSSDVLVSTGDKLNVDLVSDRNNIQVRVLLLLCSVLGCGLAARAGLGMGLRLRLGEETATSSVLPRTLKTYSIPLFMNENDKLISTTISLYHHHLLVVIIIIIPSLLAAADDLSIKMLLQNCY